jgi:hypothetical protein
LLYPGQQCLTSKRLQQCACQKHAGHGGTQRPPKGKRQVADPNSLPSLASRQWGQPVKSERPAPAATAGPRRGPSETIQTVSMAGCYLLSSLRTMCGWNGCVDSLTEPERGANATDQTAARRSSRATRARGSSPGADPGLIAMAMRRTMSCCAWIASTREASLLPPYIVPGSNSLPDCTYCQRAATAHG